QPHGYLRAAHAGRINRRLHRTLAVSHHVVASATVSHTAEQLVAHDSAQPAGHGRIFDLPYHADGHYPQTIGATVWIRCVRLRHYAVSLPDGILQGRDRVLERPGGHLHRGFVSRVPGPADCDGGVGNSAGTGAIAEFATAAATTLPVQCAEHDFLGHA